MSPTARRPAGVSPPFVLVAWRTDIGRRRKNEDAVVARHDLVSERGAGALIAVADGVGGTAGGEVASRTAIAAIDETMAAPCTAAEESAGHGGIDGLASRLAAGVTAAHARLRAPRLNLSSPSQLSTTLTAVVIADDTAAFVHLGDSRAYLVRDGQVRQLTTDHTVAEELMTAGVLGRADAPFHRGGDALTRCLSPGTACTPDQGRLPVAPGDLLLVCSDGLYRAVDAATLRTACGPARPMCQADLDALADRLLAAALENGADDNISFALAALVS